MQARYVGTGSADTTREELLLTQHRDTYASLLGRHNMLVYMGAAENQCLARTRLRLLRSMIRPTVAARRPEAPAACK